MGVCACVYVLELTMDVLFHEVKSGQERSALGIALSI